MSLEITNDYGHTGLQHRRAETAAHLDRYFELGQHHCVSVSLTPSLSLSVPFFVSIPSSPCIPHHSLSFTHRHTHILAHIHAHLLSFTTAVHKGPKNPNCLAVFVCGRDSSGNRLLSEDEDSWGDSWGGDWGKDDSNPASGKPQKQSKSASNSDWSAGNDDDLEAWLNEDSPYKGMLNKEKPNKKTTAPTTKEAKRPSSGTKTKSSSKGDDWNDVEWDSGFTSPGKQKEPLVGNLLDLGTDDTATSSGKASSGWDNEVWADDDDEWQTLDLDSGSAPKGKKSS